MKGNRQGSLSRSITRRSDQNRKIKYCFHFAILPQLVKKVRSDFFDKLKRPPDIRRPFVYISNPYLSRRGSSTLSGRPPSYRARP